MTGKVVLVHNGIVENYLELKEELLAEGVIYLIRIRILRLLSSYRTLFIRSESFSESVRKALSHLRGAHGIVVMSSLEPDKLIAARIGNAGGVVIGLVMGRIISPQTCRQF
jgi:glucosamine--fructose-6-phosphate aminotransferase (isomerizing)